MFFVSIFADTIVVQNYTFNKATKQITFTDYGSINIEYIDRIIHLKSGRILFQSGQPDRFGTVSGNVLTLNFDTNLSDISNSDKLQIKYISSTQSLPSGAATSALQTTGNTTLSNIDSDIGASNDASAPTGNGSFISISKAIRDYLAGVLQVRGTRSNAGTDLASGNGHLTVGGSDGTNLRALTVDPTGRIVVKRGALNQFRNTVTLTGTTETTLIPAVSGIRHCLQFLIICNNSTTDRVTLSLRDSTGGTVIPLGGFEPNASGKSPAIPFHFPASLEQTTANNNWTIQASGTSPNVTIVSFSERVN